MDFNLSLNFDHTNLVIGILEGIFIDILVKGMSYYSGGHAYQILGIGYAIIVNLVVL